MVRITLKHGLCNESIVGLIQFGGILCLLGKKKADIESGARVAELALSLVKRCDFLDMTSAMYYMYYAFVAVHTESLQSCCTGLCKGIQGTLLIVLIVWHHCWVLFSLLHLS